MNTADIAALVLTIIAYTENIMKLGWLSNLVGGWGKQWKIITLATGVGLFVGLKPYWISLIAMLPPMLQQTLVVLYAIGLAIGTMGVGIKLFRKVNPGNGAA